MSDIYWVVGGRYTDTSFSQIEKGQKEVRLGPFQNYDQAKAVWRAKAMETVDEAFSRFSIEREVHDEFWVIGGVYTGTDFNDLADGAAEERHGPFESYDEAQSKWRERSMATIDDAYARFRIEKL